MSRKFAVTALTGAAVHTAIVAGTRPELKFQAVRRPELGLVGELNMKNTSKQELSFTDGYFSADVKGNPKDYCELRDEFPDLESLGKTQRIITRSANNQPCFGVKSEWDWKVLERLNVRWNFEPGDQRTLATVQFGFADTPEDLTYRAEKEARRLRACFHVACKPLPGLIPSYVIWHEFDLADIIADANKQ
jgi:hypothetical protein